MATYYFADNAAPNAHPNAIQGNDSWNGLHPTFIGGSNGPKRNPATFNWGVINSGDSVLFARGSYWSNSFSAFVESPASSSMARTSMIRFGQYDPGTGVTGKPWFNSSGTGWQFHGFGGSGAPVHGGYILENLRITGPGVSGDNFGVIINPPLQWIIVQDCEIWNFKAGVNMRQEPNGWSRYVVIRRNDFRGCGIGGILGSAENSLIEGNFFTGNGELHALTHAIYYGSGENETRNHTLRHNHLQDNNINGSGVCVGGCLTTRGKMRGLHIEGNLLENTGTRYNTDALGISHFPGYASEEYHFMSRILRNTLRNFRNHIVFGSAPGIHVRDNILVDNGSVADGTPSCTGIAWPQATIFTPGDTTPDSAAVVTGNSFTSTAPRAGTRGLSTNGGADNSPGTGVVINGNTFNLGSGTTDVLAFNLTETNTSYASISNNTLVGGNGWHSGRTSLAAFQAYYAGLGVACTGNTGG